MPANDDGDHYADEPTENDIENDLRYADSEGEFNEIVRVALEFLYILYKCDTNELTL